MRRVLWLTCTAALALSTTSCQFFGGGGTEEVTTTVTQSPVPVPRTQASPSPQTSPSPAAEPPGAIVLPDLISSTDPNQRVQQVESNRSDPFALIPTTPTIQRPEPEPGQGSAPNGASPTATQPGGTTARTPNQRTTSTNRGGTTARTPNQRTNTTPRARTNPPGTLAPVPNLIGRGSTPTLAPAPRPQPELARAVKVTGVVQVGDTVFAIVDAPNEPHSRYVKPGQRLSNGQVLVRRIETSGAEPVVVLEQFGVEVVKAVDRKSVV